MLPRVVFLSLNLIDCGLGYDILSKTLVECRNGAKLRYVGLVGEFAKLSVGKAEKKRGDVASLVVAAAQSFPC